jgi:hypothetical protein
VNADEAATWDEFNKRYEMKRINHQEAYSDDGACTNWAEEYFSRLRRAEIGHHHHIAGTYLLRYAQESSSPVTGSGTRMWHNLRTRARHSLTKLTHGLGFTQ